MHHDTAIQGLEPQAVWRFFAELSAVPRPSKHEEQIRERVRQLAQQHNFGVRQDAVGNLVIDVPATPGHEQAAPTVLQGHLDMVCEKNAGTEHDFQRDPIHLVRDTDSQGEEIIRARGTTLGADNGIGVALAFAAATAPGVVHGPLEILCTTDEEMGMTGAKVLEPEFLRGRRMLNLDSEEDDALYIGCAGGLDSTVHFERKAAPPPGRARALRVRVSGLRGGHSGGNIHENRGNAIKLLVQTLRAAEGSPRLAEFVGGSKRNAIPREATAVVVGSSKLVSALKTAAEMVQAEARAAGEPGCRIAVEAAELPAAVLSAADTQRLLATMAALPHGVLATVPEIPGLVQTSNGMTTVEFAAEDGKLRYVIGNLSRSSRKDELHAAARQVAAVAQLAGARVESGGEYPGWAPNVHSPTLGVCKQVYERLFGAPPRVTAIHAGLECGLIGERIPGMDMVSFGPHIEGAHSPDERVYVRSVQKSWRYLTAVLEELARA